jgi:hypothetical protein
LIIRRVFDVLLLITTSILPYRITAQSLSCKKYKIIFVKTSKEPIEKAITALPDIKYEITIVSIVPIIHQEIDLTILFTGLSLTEAIVLIWGFLSSNCLLKRNIYKIYAKIYLCI